MDIKKALKAHGITIAEAASKMGVDRVTLSRTINNNPTINTLKRISDVTGVSLLEFFSDEQSGPVLICPHCGKPIHINVRAE